MIKFSQFITEAATKKDTNSLHVFDMDETLFAHDHHKLRVHVLDPYGNRVRTLSNQEFNTHQLPPGHRYDFGEFRSSDIFTQSAKPIRKMIAKLKAIKKNGGKTAAWQRKAGKDPKGGLNRKGIASYRRENPGSKLSMAVTTKPSKLKKGSKAWNRRKSFCARMSGMKRRLTSAKTARDPNSRINKSLRKWNC